MTKSKKAFSKIALLAFLLLSSFAHAQDSAQASKPSDAAPMPKKKFVHDTRYDIPAGEQALTFGALYLAQWGIYIIDQNDKIRSQGSFKNWQENPFRPHFDNDNFKYNLIWHTVTGQLYFQYYRSRGYTEISAFAWTVLSSLAFEFTIETVTEPPSFQDIYQTPVFGTVIGLSFERLSNYLHSQDTWATHALGYLFNPFTIFPFSKYKFQTAPMVSNKEVGAIFTMQF